MACIWVGVDVGVVVIPALLLLILMALILEVLICMEGKEEEKEAVEVGGLCDLAF